MEEEKLKKQVTILEIVRIALIFFIILEGVAFACMRWQDNCNFGGALLNTADAHNRQFLQYQGVQTGATLKTLISTIEQYNISGATDESEFILVKNVDVSKEIRPSSGAYIGQTAKAFNKQFENVKLQINIYSRYNITFAYDEDTGYIIEVGFQEVNSIVPQNNL